VGAGHSSGLTFLTHRVGLRPRNVVCGQRCNAQSCLLRGLVNM